MTFLIVAAAIATQACQTGKVDSGWTFGPTLSSSPAPGGASPAGSSEPAATSGPATSSSP